MSDLRQDLQEAAPLSRRDVLRGAFAAAAGAAALALGQGRALAQEDGPDPFAPEVPANGPEVPAGLMQEAGATNFLPVELEGAASVAQPELAVLVLNRLAYGPRPGSFDYDTFRSRPGADDVAKLTNWVDWQLNPNFGDDPDYLPRRFGESINKNLGQLWQDYRRASNANRVQPVEDVRADTFNRALYSKWQLFEMVTEFWHNHFSIYAWDYAYAGPTWVSWDRDVIRAHALGNFRALLGAVARHPAMLFYLDNYLNDKGSNENWARELMELHALGAENYLGAGLQQNQVPGYPSAPVGYVDNDVYEGARAFAGWRVKDGMWPYDAEIQKNDGSFYFYQEWSDRFQKIVLGRTLGPDPAPEDHGNQVLDLVAIHPGTARFICRKLIRRFITDTPPQALVESAAAVFLANTSAPDQMKRVIRHILLADDFRTNWGNKVKRPFEYAVGILRTTRATVRLDLDALYWNYDDMGQSMFSWRPPNGYPDVATAWINTNGLMQRWSFANRALMSYIDQWVGNGSVDVVATPEVDADYGAGYRTVQNVLNYWQVRILGRFLDPARNTELVRILGNGNPNATWNQPPTGNSGNDQRAKLRHTLALIFMSPEFLYR
jgi:uncharacterized protein (DUF1800 family)